MLSPSNEKDQKLLWANLTALITTVVLALSLLAAPASAHSTNESYVFFNVSEDNLGGRIEVTLTDLAKIKAGSTETEGPLSEDEVTQGRALFIDYLQDHIALSNGGRPYAVTFGPVTYLETPADTFAQFSFSIDDVGEVPGTIEMGFDPLLELDPTHRGYALIESNTRNGMSENESFISLVFEPNDGVQTLNLNDEPTEAVALRFLVHGVWHIWLGFDHVLFLVALLLSSVMVLRARQWEPSDGLRASLINVVKIVTVFTVAHTITLSLATFGIITLPVALVEAIIALSIAVIALGNLIPKLHITSWKVVFAFGLFHGFGFANVLAPLGLEPARKAIGLATFNIGVELGQLAIVIVIFPVLFMLRRSAFYRVAALQVGSVLLIAIALFWFAERTFGALGTVG